MTFTYVDQVLTTEGDATFAMKEPTTPMMIQNVLKKMPWICLNAPSIVMCTPAANARLCAGGVTKKRVSGVLNACIVVSPCSATMPLALLSRPISLRPLPPLLLCKAFSDTACANAIL